MAMLDNLNKNSDNGAAMAAVLAAAVGSFALGLFVLIHEAGIYSAPSLYAPAGGLSGRAAFATVIWLVTWFVLHRKWQGQNVDQRSVSKTSMVLLALAVMALFPPFWQLLG